MNNAKPSPFSLQCWMQTNRHKHRVNKFFVSAISNWVLNFLPPYPEIRSTREWRNPKISINYSFHSQLHHSNILLVYRDERRQIFETALLCPRLVSKEFQAADLFWQSRRMDGEFLTLFLEVMRAINVNNNSSRIASIELLLQGNDSAR